MSNNVRVNRRATMLTICTGLATLKRPGASLATAFEDVLARTQKDLEVAPQRPVRGVQVVDRDHLIERDACRSEDLPMPGHAGFGVQSPSVPANYPGIFLGHQWTRAHQAHLSAQDVPELRQLVERAPSQHAANPSRARIGCD